MERYSSVLHDATSYVPSIQEPKKTYFTRTILSSSNTLSPAKYNNVNKLMVEEPKPATRGG